MISFLVIALIIFGCLLLFCEILLPGGVIGVCGGIAILAGTILGFRESTTLGLSALATAGIFGPVALILGMWALPKTPLAKKLFLKSKPAPPGIKAWKGDTDQTPTAIARPDLIGQEAVTLCPLRPAGTIELDGHRYDVVTRGEMIDKGARVRIDHIDTNRIIVEEID